MYRHQTCEGRDIHPTSTSGRERRKLVVCLARHSPRLALRSVHILARRIARSLSLLYPASSAMFLASSPGCLGFQHPPCAYHFCRLCSAPRCAPASPPLPYATIPTNAYVSFPPRYRHRTFESPAVVSEPPLVLCRTRSLHQTACKHC
jgi:hypothetical protein